MNIDIFVKESDAEYKYRLYSYPDSLQWNDLSEDNSVADYPGFTVAFQFFQATVGIG